MWIAYRRQRRRIAATMSMVVIAMIIGFIGQSGWLYVLMDAFGGQGLVSGIQAAATVLLASFLATLVTLRFAPSQRQQCEIIAGSAIVFQIVSLVLASSGMPFSSPLLAVCGFVLVVIVLDNLVYGNLLDFMGLWRPLAAKHRFGVEAPPHAAWNAIVPRPDTVSTHWIRALTEVTQTHEADVYRARYRLGDGTILQKTLTVLAQDHPHHMRYHFEPEADSEESRFGAGFYEVRINALADGVTEVTVLCEYTALRSRTALMLWLDDWLGSEGDAISAFIEQRPDRGLHTRLWGEVLRQAA